MKDKPTYRATPADYERLPAALANYPYWCLWRYEQRGDNWTKPPFSAHGGNAASDRPNTFDKLTRVLAVLKRRPDRYSGIGIGVFGDLVAVDIDDCVSEDGGFNEVAEAVVEKLDSYSELSPSGCGLRIIVTCPGFTYDKAKYYVNRKGVMEFYSAGMTKKYVSITGNSFDEPPKPVREVDYETLMQILDRFMRRDEKPTVEANTAADASEKMNDDALAIEVAEVMDRMRRGSNWDKTRALLDGESPSGDVSADDQALCNIVAFYSQNNTQVIDSIFRESKRYRDKWDEQRGAQTYGELTIRRAVEDCTEVWSPSYHPAPTGAVAAALEWLESNDVTNNHRYRLDGIGGSYMLADYLKPTARYCDDLGAWYVYDGIRWKKDPKGCAVAEKTKILSRALGCFAGKITNDDRRKAWLRFAEQWCSLNARRNFLTDAQSVWKVSALAFDTRGDLLNCPNGTLDTSTMTFRAHDPADLITKVTAAEYIPGASLPRWSSFVEEIFPGDPETLNFMQRWLGYSVTGDLSEQKMVMARGRSTRNGKSTLFETVSDVLGDYATSMNPESLSESNRVDGRGPSEDMARLRGVRFVTIPEPKKTLRLDAAKVKQMTGGDTIIARMLNENSVPFRSVAHLTMNANRLPDINDMTVFASNRILLVPFVRHFEEDEQDNTLRAQFSTQEAKNAVLAWLIEGLKMYKKDRLKPSKAMVQELTEYRVTSDKVSRYISEMLPDADDPLSKVPLVSVYNSYACWCREAGCYAEARNGFAAELADRGIQITKGRPSGGGSVTTVVIGKKILPLPVYADDIIHTEEGAPSNDGLAS